MIQTDTPHFSHIAQRAPLAMLWAFLEVACIDLAQSLDRNGKEKALRSGLKKAAHALPDDVRRRLDQTCERIDRMTDEAGAEAIRYIRDEIINLEAFEQQADQYARSLWLYLNERENFQRAEDARYADEYRGSIRLYGAYRGPAEVDIAMTEERRDALLTSLAELFHTPFPVLFDHFVRPRHDIEKGEDIELHQFSIHHNDEQQSVPTIAEDGDLALIYFCPLNSIKITYEPLNGVVEVYCRNRSLHDEIFQRFARHILNREMSPERLPKRCYDISTLARERHFPIVDAEIASVRVLQLRIKVGSRRSSLILKLGAAEARTIWQLAEDLWGSGNPLNQAHQIDQANLVIQFHKRRHQRRPKSLTIVISLPNGCNIKSHCDKDRQLADKYLRLWNLIQSEESPTDDAESTSDQEPSAAL